MRFEELIEKDKCNAFAEFVSVATAKKEHIIPPDYVSYFPDTCSQTNAYGKIEGCGSDMIIKRNLSQIMCCNPRCRIKLAYALDQMLDKFNCKNVGEQTCKNLVYYAYDYMQMKSHLEILTIEDKYLVPDVRGMTFVYFKQAIEKVKSTPLTFADMVSRIAIPEFQGNAHKVFHDISGIQDLIETIKRHGSIEMFLEFRGIQDKMKTFYLTEFLKDIAYAEVQIFGGRLRKPGKVKIPISITGSLLLKGNRITKDSFVQLCNDIGTIGNLQLFEVELNTALETNDFIIADSKSHSTKYLTGVRRENIEKRKILYTSEEFVTYLKELVECVMKEKPQTNPI